MTDNGTPKVCDEGKACMFMIDYTGGEGVFHNGYIRDCRPLNDSLPNCYNETMHDVIHPFSIINN